jgi:predicted nucleotidyltransferase
MDSSININFLPNLLAEEISLRFPGAYGAYLFGSAASGQLRPESDLDVAILRVNPLSPDEVLELKSFISQKFRRDSDILDLYRVDSVTAAQVVTTGFEILSLNPFKMAEFETMALSRYALLNEERREILKDIEATGTVYGR